MEGDGGRDRKPEREIARASGRKGETARDRVWVKHKDSVCVRARVRVSESVGTRERKKKD